MTACKNSSKLPTTYYSFSPDFDYRKYMEERSHFNSVILAIDESTRDIIGSVDSINTHVSQGFTSLSGEISDAAHTISSELRTISIDLNQIRNSIDDLSLICDIGFERLSTETIRSNVLLSELITLFQTPDQVWAREQFEYAKQCSLRELWEDALKYVNKSINGDERNSGFHIEPAFHLLKGQILLQYPAVEEGNRFLELALASFKNASKYAGRDQTTLKGLAHRYASWCFYCLGEFDEAANEISSSIKCDPDPSISHFFAAKYNARLGRQNEAALALANALLTDEILFLRAKNDFDFINNGVDLEAVAAISLRERIKQFKEFCENEINYRYLQELLELNQNISDCDFSDKAIISEIDWIKEQNNLPTYNRFFLKQDELGQSPADLIKERALRAIDQLEVHIKNKIQELKSTRKPELKLHHQFRRVPKESAMLLGAVLAVTGSVVVFILLTAGQDAGPVWNFIGGAVSLVIAVVVGVVLYLPLLGMAFLILKLVFNIQDSIEIRKKKKDIEIKNARERAVFEKNLTKGEEIEERFSEIFSLFAAFRVHET